MKNVKLKLQKIVNYRPLFFMFMAFFFGILSARRLFAGEAWYIVFAVVGILGIVFICLLQKKLLAMILLVTTFFIGTGFYFIGICTFSGKEYTGEQTVVARATDTINDFSWGTSVVVDNVYINGESAKSMILTIEKDEQIEIQAGDILTFKSYVNSVKLFELGDFQTYYFRNHTAYEAVVSASELSITHGNTKVDEKIRLFILQVLQENMSEENASLAFSALTGNKSFIDKETKSFYNRAGIVHLLTVSGLHISFLTALLAWILKKCRVNRFVNFFINAIFLILYCFICGFTPSVVRASIMGLVLILAPIFAKEYDPLTSLGMAGMIILLISPLSAFDGGFLMSFFAVMCIFMLYRPLTDLFKKFLPSWIGSSFALSISAQIGILPFIAMYSGTFNPLTIFANLVVIPFFGMLFPLLFVSSLIAMIPHFGWALAPAKLGFNLITIIAEFFSGTKVIINLQPFDSFITILIFIATFILSYFVMIKGYWKVFSMSILLLIGVLCFAVSPSFYSTCYTSATILTSGNVFLTNSQGQVAFIGKDLKEIDKTWLRKNKIEKVSFFFMVGNWDGDFIFKARDYSANEVISITHKNYTSEEVCVGENEWKHAGEYTFIYHCVEGKEVGIEINFDSFSFFFTTNEDLSYNMTEYLKNYFATAQLDVVALGRNYWLSEYVKNPGAFVGKYDSDYVDYSSTKDGNIKLVYDDRLYVRRID